MALKLVALLVCVAAAAAAEDLSIIKYDCTGPNRYGQCPSWERKMQIQCIQYYNQCKDDEKCPLGYKCCESYCGRQCVPICSKPCPCEEVYTIGPYPIEPEPATDCTGPNRYGQCPSIKLDPRIQVRCMPYDQCVDDQKCPLGYKCCESYCGRQCVPICSKPCPCEEVYTIGPYPIEPEPVLE